jgi:AAA+ superfamily predicted ATPase
MFIIKNDNKFQLISSQETNTTNRLESGVYNLIMEKTGPMTPPEIIFQKTDIYKKGVRLDIGIFKDCRKFVNSFFSPYLAQARKEMSMMNKVGIMLSGEPGTGKTFLAGQLSQETCDSYDAVAIIVDKVNDYSNLIDTIRQADPDRNIIIVIDEFEKSFNRYNTEPLSFLDGSKSRDNVMIIATVNDHNELPSFVTDRPSRFEKIFKFDFGNEEILTVIIENLIPELYRDKVNIKDISKELVKQSNKSIDKIKHYLRDIIANKIEQEETGVKKSVIIDTKNEPTPSKGQIGFLKSSEISVEKVPSPNLDKLDISNEVSDIIFK